MSYEVQINREGNDATDSENLPLLADIGFKELETSLREARDLIEKINFAKMLRKGLAVENPPISEVMGSDIALILMSYLNETEQRANVQHQELVHEALWVLTNLASGPDDTCRELVEFGVIPAAVGQVKASPSSPVVEQALWLIGNIAGTSPECRDLCLEAGALDEALKALGMGLRLNLQRVVSWVTSNLLRGKPSPSWDRVYKALPYVVALMKGTDDETKTNALWSLAYLTDDDDDALHDVASFDVCSLVVENLQRFVVAVGRNVQTQLTNSTGSDKLQQLIPALRCAANFLNAPDYVAQTVIDAGALNSFAACITNAESGVRRETLWAISNATAGTPSQIQAVIDAGLLPAILNACMHDTQECSKEARWAIMNAITGANRAQTLRLAEIPQVRAALAVSLQDREAALVRNALDATVKMLKEGNKIKHGQQLESNPFVVLFEESGIVNVLNMLQAHENHEIYNRTASILARYFVEDAPTITSDAAPASFVFS